MASMSKPFTTRMVGCKFPHQVWKKLEEFFASQTKDRVSQFKNQLKKAKKEGSLSIYLLEIKKAVDSLASIGAPVTKEDRVMAILDGLSEKHSVLITVVTSKFDSFAVGEVKALFMAHKDRLERFRQINNVQANVAQFSQQKRSNSRAPQQDQRFNSDPRNHASEIQEAKILVAKDKVEVAMVDSPPSQYVKCVVK